MAADNFFKIISFLLERKLCRFVLEIYKGKGVCSRVYSPYSAVAGYGKDAKPNMPAALEVKGIGGGKFAPDELVNREQIAAMMQRAVKVMKPEADQSTAGAEAFSDEKDISNWALDSVKFINKQGLLKGANGKFGPKDSTTREQAIVIVVRTYDKYSK